MKKVFSFIRREAVLCCSAVLALVSMCWAPPSTVYFTYIDWRVLALLFCLMLVVAGWRTLGLFQVLGAVLIRYAHSLRGLSLVFVGLCFFSSMMITNDVALLTFVPFTIAVLSEVGLTGRLIHVVVLETIAANLGSMMTPIGNPQNLFLFSQSGWTAGHFLLWMLPLTFVSLLAIGILLWLQPNLSFPPTSMEAEPERSLDTVVRSWRFWLYLGLFLLCLANVLHFIGYGLVFLLVTVCTVLVDRKLLCQVDYCLLLTFICFFLFIGNVQELHGVRTLLSDLISGRELWMGVAVSQVISNVPAAMLLSGFTTDYADLLWGVNIGGLGTLIASMASLISYKAYMLTKEAAAGRYLLVFSAYNGVLLVLLCGVAALLGGGHSVGYICEYRCDSTR